MKLTVPRDPGAKAPRSLRDRPLRRGARVQARVMKVFAGRLRLVIVEGRRLLLQSDLDVEPGDTLEFEVVSARPLPRFRAVNGGRTIWSIPVGRSHVLNAPTQG